MDDTSRRSAASGDNQPCASPQSLHAQQRRFALEFAIRASVLCRPSVSFRYAVSYRPIRRVLPAGAGGGVGAGAAKHLAHKIFLLAASYVFYGVWSWRYVPLLFACRLSPGLVAQQIQRREDARERKRVAGRRRDCLPGGAGLLQVHELPSADAAWACGSGWGMRRSGMCPRRFCRWAFRSSCFMRSR